MLQYVFYPIIDDKIRNAAMGSRCSATIGVTDNKKRHAAMGLQCFAMIGVTDTNILKQDVCAKMQIFALGSVADATFGVTR